MAMGEKAAPRRLVPGGPCVCVCGGGNPSLKPANRHHLPRIFVTSPWFSVVQMIFPSIPFSFLVFRKDSSRGC